MKAKRDGEGGGITRYRNSSGCLGTTGGSNYVIYRIEDKGCMKGLMKIEAEACCKLRVKEREVWAEEGPWCEHRAKRRMARCKVGRPQTVRMRVGSVDPVRRLIAI
jgi:hypothetical protein